MAKQFRVVDPTQKLLQLHLTIDGIVREVALPVEPLAGTAAALD